MIDLVQPTKITPFPLGEVIIDESNKLLSYRECCFLNLLLCTWENRFLGTACACTSSGGAERA